MKSFNKINNSIKRYSRVIFLLGLVSVGCGRPSTDGQFPYFGDRATTQTQAQCKAITLTQVSLTSLQKFTNKTLTNVEAVQFCIQVKPMGDAGTRAVSGTFTLIYRDSVGIYTSLQIPSLGAGSLDYQNGLDLFFGDKFGTLRVLTSAFNSQGLANGEIHFLNQTFDYIRYATGVNPTTPYEIYNLMVSYYRSPYTDYVRKLGIFQMTTADILNQ